MPEPLDPEAAYKIAKADAAHYVAQQVKALKEDPALQDRLYKLIDYAIKRFDWYEEQRFKFLQVGLAFITVTAGLSGFLANVRQQMSTISLGLSFSAVVSLLLTGIKLMLVYNELRGITYPYRKIADIRSWFFKYNFDSLPAALSTEAEQAVKEVNEVAKAYKVFVDRWTEYANKERGFIEEDLQQVFILQLLQSYRRESLERMHVTLLWGVAIFVSLSVLAVLSFFLIPPTPAP
jgi:hypothetical protein